jgi:DNA (cytosine-5)-methyltransferase 1
VSVANALKPLDRLAPEVLFRDDRHQPSSMKTLNSKISYDPHKSFLKGCITTGGGANYHFSGNRRYTPRENSLFQTFPYGYHFTGSNSEANKQIGNAFPPCMSEKLYSSCAQMLEAYDNGLIEAEADITDLDQYLEANGVVLPQRASTPRDLFTPSASSRFSTPENPYRYLFCPENRPAAACTPRVVSRSQSLFGASKDIEPQSQTEKKKQTPGFSFLNNRDAEPRNAEWRTKKRRDDLTNDEKFKIAKENGDLIELDSD